MEEKMVCPKNPGHNEFYTTAHEAHDWKVDGHGNFIKDLGLSEFVHLPYPGDGNKWVCAICGSTAVLVRK
ncbi:hypothetical protein Tfer_0863 [Thermincola ferriacetica]|uniref:Uncharacterized protein n=1 Tax=Thermincola ferriacetica TaxID=281456 RepID=A0A0L6W4I1_9FIRM|nr:hypothetical protein [Thermincola ferriacetica]KNZ70303.1 hypothetical protein Tfer_0863 [Thermincola ferriacetica]